MKWRQITPQQFQQEVNWQSDSVVDVRSPAEHKSQHVTGAINLPLDNLKAEQLSGSKIYLLCKSGKRATMAAEKLCDNYEGELIVIEGGTDSCAANGIPCTSSGKQHMSLERQVRIAAGSLVVLGCLLGYMVNSGFYLLSTFVGAGLVFAGITDTCGMGMLISKMPWNKR
ncbi:rhodanese-like domain-containing protein [Porticoccaceae bacterium LTM1]|nr:rhodanese-like domain-containing protein [Porticoccaceae bacterium LTM1]